MTDKLIHIGRYQKQNGGTTYLYLRKKTSHHFVWYEEDGDQEIETTASAPNIEEAMRLANQQWKNQSFRTVICGFRYTLPERDEHGINALFHQMVSSYSSMNNVYFDEDMGHNCFVQNASHEALDLYHKLKKENRL